MERDLSFVFALGAAVVICVGVAWFGSWWRKRQQVAEDQSIRLKEAAQAKKLVEAGTHVLAPDGAVVLKCRYCKEPATRRPFTWVRDSGVLDLVRRTFGAPARVRVGRREWADPVACELHDPMAYEEFRVENGEYEVDRAKLESHWETRRARFEREGVHERVRARIEKHERELGGRKRRSGEVVKNVVPFGGSSRTGT